MLFGSTVLEVGIGVVFVFILVSIICTTIREGIEAWLKTRAAFLEHGIRELLHDKPGQGLARKLYDHPLIYSLFNGEYTPGSATTRPSAWTKGGELPSYIPARNFAVALFDIAARGPADSATSTPAAPLMSLQEVRDNILNIQNPRVQRVMLTAIDTAQGDLNQAQKNLEDWYNSGMDRVSGAYRRSTQWVLFWVGLSVAVSLNINTLSIAHYLYHNDAARAALVKQAEAIRQADSTKVQTPGEVVAQLDKLPLPIGWGPGQGIQIKEGSGIRGVATSIWNDPWNNLFGPILGWLLTAFAAMLGAPFWFDMLNKMMVIRSTVKPHEKSPEEDSEDRQLTRPTPTGAAAPVAPVVPVVPLVAPVVPPAPPAPPAPADHPPHDSEDVDGCAVEMDQEFTEDEYLPAAEGGVA